MIKKIEIPKWQKELDNARERHCYRIALTDEQKEFIIYARAHSKPVSFTKMAEIWEQQGWGKYSKCSIQRRVKILEDEIEQRKKEIGG